MEHLTVPHSSYAPIRPVLQSTAGGSSTLVFHFHLTLVLRLLQTDELGCCIVLQKSTFTYEGTVLCSSVTNCPSLQSSVTVLKILYSSIHFVLLSLINQFLIYIQVYKHVHIIYYACCIWFFLSKMSYNWNYITYGLLD